MSTNTSNTPNNNKKLLIIAASLTLFFALIEIIYGFISGSLMIIGDGIHMSSDAISLILSLIAAVVATRASTNKRTFGYKRFEPIAAFINGLTLVLVPLYIIFEAFNRIITPIEINPTQMLVVGIIGLAINAIVGLCSIERTIQLKYEKCYFTRNRRFNYKFKCGHCCTCCYVLWPKLVRSNRKYHHINYHYSWWYKNHKRIIQHSHGRYAKRLFS